MSDLTDAELDKHEAEIEALAGVIISAIGDSSRSAIVVAGALGLVAAGCAHVSGNPEWFRGAMLALLDDTLAAVAES